MGRSAKVHKRVPKKLKLTSSSAALPAATSAASIFHSAPQQSKAKNAKKRADLKAKTSSKSKHSGQSDDGGAGVLGGADYVSLLMGGRRKAKEEAEKLPQDED